MDALYKCNHIIEYADGNHGSLYPRKEDFGEEGVLFLTAAQIESSGSAVWSECPRLKFSHAEKLNKGWSSAGDVYFTHTAIVGRTRMSVDMPEIRCY